MVLSKDITSQIKGILKKKPQGMNITQIVSEIGINRNTVGRYLENLLVSGQVEMRRFGMEKIYSLSRRVPLSAVLSISSEFVVQLDSSLRIIFANEPFLTLVGTNGENLIGKNIEYTPVALVFDELFTGFVENIREGITGKEWSGEIVLSTKNINFFCRIAPTVFDDGRKGVSVILEDITQRKRAEDALHESEKEYRTLAEASTDLIFVIGKDDRVEYVNSYASGLVNKPAGQIIGCPRSSLFPPDVAINQKKALEKVFDTGAHVRNEGPLTFAGQVHWFDHYLTPLKDADNHVRSVLGISRDITERKQAELSLRESEDRYRSLVEISPDAVILHSEGIIIYANPATLGLLGASHPDQIIGKKILDFIPIGFKGTVRKNIQKDLEGQATPKIELFMLRIDGTPILVEGRGIGTIIDGKPAVQVTIRDITEQKRAEETLKIKERQLYSTFTNVPEILFLFSIEQDNCYRFLIVNKSFLDAIRLAENAVIGKEIHEVISEPLNSKILDKNRQAILEKKTIRWEEVITEAAGKRYVDIAITPIFDESGHPTNIIGSVHDYTDHKRMEVALQESEEKYRTFIERANDGICVVQDRIIKMCNRSVSELWGESIEQIVGRNFMDFIHPDALSEIVDRYNRRMANQPTPSIYETKLKRKDGSIFHAELNAGIVSYEGEPADLIIIRDINDRKKAEVAFRESEATARALINAPTDSVILMDTQGIILALNETAALRFGKTSTKLVGALADDLLPKEVAQARRVLITQVIDKKAVVRFEDERGGRSYDTVAYPILSDEGEVNKIAIVARDITERKNTEKQLRESEQLYQRLLEQSFDAIAIHKNKRIVFLNEKAAKILGAATPADLIGRSIFDFIHPVSLKDLQERILKLKDAQGMPVPILQERFIRLDGTTVTVEVMAISFDDKGTPVFRVAFREIASKERE